MKPRGDRKPIVPESPLHLYSRGGSCSRRDDSPQTNDGFSKVARRPQFVIVKKASCQKRWPDPKGVLCLRDDAVVTTIVRNKLIWQTYKVGTWGMREHLRRN